MLESVGDTSDHINLEEETVHLKNEVFEPIKSKLATGKILLYIIKE